MADWTFEGSATEMLGGVVDCKRRSIEEAVMLVYRSGSWRCGKVSDDSRNSQGNSVDLAKDLGRCDLIGLAPTRTGQGQGYERVMN